MARPKISRRPVYSRRREILEILKREGPLSADALAERLGITAVAVRQQLGELQRDDLVVSERQARPVGRPVRLWCVTAEATEGFPDRHAALAASVLTLLPQACGSETVPRLVAAWVQGQLADYRQRLPNEGPLLTRLVALAEIRSEEGYMAAVETTGGTDFLLVENHCPIRAAAAACGGLCAGELALFRAALGARVQVERSEHMLNGDRRCAYRVRQE